MTPDAIIEEAVKPWFRDTFKSWAAPLLARKEWGLLNHTGRADLAVITPANFLHLVEVKGQNDDCRRLRGQAVTYSKVAHFCYLFAVPKLAAEALTIVPSWWGVFSAGIAGTAQLQPPRLNPDLKAKDVLGLLWADELRELARARSVKVSGRKQQVIERIATGGSRVLIGKALSVIRNRKDGDGARPFFAAL